jgi:hypothetical protein
MKKYIASFLLILVLFAGISFGLHHHDDGLPHDDCLTCIAASHCQYIIPDNNTEVKSHVFLAEAVPSADISAVITPFTANLPIRSPPVFC